MNNEVSSLVEIQKILKAEGTSEAKAFFQKAVPTPLHIYGVKAPLIDGLVKKYKGEGFDLVEDLWKAGSLEERIMAAKVLGAICKRDPDRTLVFLEKFTPELEDWAVCDGLGVGGMRGISKIKENEIWELALKYQKSKHIWTRRMGIILMLHYAKDIKYRRRIEQRISALSDDKEHYIKKAIVWMNRVLKSAK